MTEKPKKPSNGKLFEKGNKQSPGRKPIYQDYNERARHLLDKYTVEQVTGMVRAVATKPSDRDVDGKRHYKAAMAMSARDFTILMSIASAFTTGGALPFSQLLDRAIGKVTQHVKVDQTVTQLDHTKQADEEAEEALQQLAKRRAEAKAKTVH